MIDFKKELALFDFMEVDSDLLELRHEALQTIQAFNSILKRLCKEQSNAEFQMEEILSILDEIKNSSKTDSELKKALISSEEEKLALINGFISVLDQFEYLYKYVLKNADRSWTEQFTIMWNNISNILLTLGITRIGDVNAIFNAQLNVAKMLSCNPALPDNIITEVLKSGYMYKSILLRKAEVVVNKTSKDGENIE